MDAFVLKGGAKLRGRVEIGGAKNAALPVLTAAILFEQKVAVDNVPDLKDIDTLCRVLAVLGVKSRREGQRLHLDGSGLSSFEAPYDLVRKMRASVYVLGPLLARLGRAKVSLPGGCAWGPRPVDLHVMAMEKLGATVRTEHGYLVAEAPTGGLRGATIHFPVSSVGATCNAILAAARAKGRTRLENAAQEPEVVALADYLAACGADIRGQGTRLITIEGVERFTPVAQSVIPDRIEAATFLAAAAITGGELELVGCKAEHLGSVIDAFKSAGSEISIDGDVVRCKGAVPPRGMHVVTAPYPGFPTDMQAQMMALATIGASVSVITDTIYPDRFTHVPELARLGADIRLEKNTAVIHPVAKLSGASVMASDLRASAALILAGLVAEGTTKVSRVYHIDRGYERIEKKLCAVGAAVERVRDEGP